MHSKEGPKALSAAEMVAHLGRLAQGEGFRCGLTTAQWTALRYFARANRFSRTVSAFADYHATTRGTASQTVKSLVTNGYLHRVKSKSDGRSARLDLTPKGQMLQNQDPFEDLVNAIAELPGGLRQNFTNALERVMGTVAQVRGKRTFGTCDSCCFLEECVCHATGEPPYHCKHLDQPLSLDEIEQICINYVPTSNGTTKRATPARVESPPE